MSLLAQCGFGRGTKIEEGLNQGIIEGVIMSPRDEIRERLERDILQWRADYPGAEILFDPQFYAATLNGPRDGHLGEYGYYNNSNGLNRTHFTSARIRQFVAECLYYQHNTLGEALSYLVSPTIFFDAFRDYWSQIALNIAAESFDYHSSLAEPKPLLLSITVTETAFQSIEAMDEFLDALTELDVEGFYLIIRRNAGPLQPAMESSSFGRFLYFCYVLAEINKYKVVVGYSDWLSFLPVAVGVSYTATGWYQNLRQFSLSRFLPSSGGQRPRKRYSSSPLLTCPLINPDLQDIYFARLLPHVLSGGPYDQILSNGPSAGEINWTDMISCLAHWYSLNSVTRRISAQSGVADKVHEAEQMILSAQALYRQLQSICFNLETHNGPDYLAEWLSAVREFRGITGI